MISQDLAAQMLDLVRAAAGPSAEVEIQVERRNQALTRFANSFIHQNIVDDSATVRLRLHVDGRTAAAGTTVVSGDGVRDLAERAVAASRTAPVDPTWPGLIGPTPSATTGTVDPATAGAEPGERAARVRAFVDAVDGLEAAGFCRTTHATSEYVNSAGHHISGSTTEAAMDGIARTGSSDGLARLASTRLADLDGALLGARAAAKARAAADAVELPPGRYEVVLEPTAVGDILQALAMYGFNAKVYAERRSFVALGAQQFDPAVTIVDDPVSPGVVGLPFDVEGTPRRRLELVTAGVMTGLIHDRRTARQLDTESTGHALAGGAAWGALAAHLHLVPPGGGEPAAEADGPPADASVAELVGRVSRGLLVTDNWYTRVLDPRTLVLTGLTRNGVWLIEDGKITTPVQNFRFTQSYPQALAPGAVLGVGRTAAGLPTEWAGMAFTTPALHLAAWNYTGGASG